MASNEDEAISEVDEDENDDYIDHGWTHTSLSVICNNIPPSLHIYPTYLILKKWEKMTWGVKDGKILSAVGSKT